MLVWSDFEYPFLGTSKAVALSRHLFDIKRIELKAINLPFNVGRACGKLATLKQELSLTILELLIMDEPEGPSKKSVYQKNSNHPKEYAPHPVQANSLPYRLEKFSSCHQELTAVRGAKAERPG